MRASIDDGKDAVERTIAAVNDDRDVNRQRAGLVENLADDAAHEIGTED